MKDLPHQVIQVGADPSISDDRMQK